MIYVLGVIILLFVGFFEFSIDKKMTFKFVILTICISLFSWFGIWYLFTSSKFNP